MKLRVFSDLHLEFAPFTPPPCDADIVLLAGDIAKARGVQWADESFDCPVLYVAGNHEFYGGHVENTLKKMKAIQTQYVHVLENESFVLNDTRFLGTTAWTDFSSTGDVTAAKRMALEWMNDFSVIRTGESYRRLTPGDLVLRNLVAREWLEQEVKKPFPGKTVVITHHCPVSKVAGDKLDSHLTAAYTNEWGDLVDMADLWVFGHTHRRIDTVVGTCRVVSNPRGYPGEACGFDPSLVIEI
ncbi:serine/threonine protein phosphatase [Pseudomonas sp. S37]|uniref:metallophosphoesterase n=1 Tax=unclassified Pseudomonas TaxID=196821 RepID=UPI001912F725|nr:MULTISPECIES: metallophosphoesterase [unclassified Pseudomonas]MBK4987700.1 serine/threonine protein phosphatase [Pseudomonas sp. S36]MBK4991852.1 serine/threonine protein phosphatase [Pseudomonas sp. S37]